MKSNNKKYILGIDTTSKIAGVCLRCDENILYESNLDTGLTHSVTLFNNIETAFKKCKISAKDLDKICVANGPGSFTGIRIGISAALGLSIPYNTKIEYVDSLKSLAYNVKNEAPYIISMIDAKVDRVYIAIYDGKNLKKILNDMIIDIETLSQNLNKYFINKNISFVFVGDGALNYKDYFKKNLNINYKLATNNNILQKASSATYVKGIISKLPKINYMLASKAERDKNGKN